MPKIKSNNSSLIEQVSKISAEAAVQAAMEYLDKQEKAKKRAKIDRRLRNTKLMLRNYRSFKKHCELIPKELEYLDGKLINDLISSELAVESIKRSKERTRAMVKFIDKMLEVYKIMCETSDKEEDRRIYLSVYFLYIAEEKKTAQELATCHNTDVRTVYRDVDKAVKTLSALIFGIDSVYFVD